MLCGYEPFYGETEKDLVEANKQAVIDFPESDWKSGMCPPFQFFVCQIDLDWCMALTCPLFSVILVSHDARDLVSKMTRPDPSERLSAKEALAHLWITANTSNDTSPVQRPTSDLPAVGACVIS